MPVPHRRAAVSALALLIAAAAFPAGAAASIFQPDVVREDPVNYTPHLVEQGGTRPFALAVAKRGGTMYVGGKFGAMENAARSRTVPRRNIMAFSAENGRLDGDFTPRFDGNVFAIRAIGDSVYVGGSFDHVNGVRRPGLAKLDARTGQLDRGFRPGAVNGGRVSEIRLVGGRLVVGGTFRRTLLALRPGNGRNTGYIDLPISGQVPGSSTKTEVYRFAVNPARTRLVAVGNFTAIDGRERRRAFMLRLGLDAARVSKWYYRPLDDRCGSNGAASPTKQAYLTDVDFSPNGRYFVFSSTGFVPEFRRQIGTHLCDAAARFETDKPRPQKPTWINYTGGDTLHSVAATGSAVYVQGHNRWLDNPLGRNTKGPGAVDRSGIGAINPATGKALPWNPRKPARQGGQDFLVTRDGLWVPSDSQTFAGEYHRGIAFVPLP